MQPSTETRSPRPPGSGFGRLLREWRQARGASQLELALTCGISQRHVSFLESGRARPSRGMALHLASTLAVPLHQQNVLLLAAGFAPAFKERPLDAPEMRQIRHALDHALKQQEPFPALVVDRVYNLRLANAAAGRLLAFLLDLDPAEATSALGEGANALLLLLRPDGLRPLIENWEEVVVWVVRRLRAEAILEGARTEADDLLQQVLGLPDVADLAHAPREEHDLPPTLVTRFRRGDTRLALFSMIATVGTPLDVSLQNLRVEFFFPADEATERWLRDAARG
jgi:transcriptional regulator with XRE-family HTH domain